MAQHNFIQPTKQRRIGIISITAADTAMQSARPQTSARASGWRNRSGRHDRVHRWPAVRSGADGGGGAGSGISDALRSAQPTGRANAVARAARVGGGARTLGGGRKGKKQSEQNSFFFF